MHHSGEDYIYTPPDSDIDDIGTVEVHWQHPRHELEQPLFLVWPNGISEEWVAARVVEGVAQVILLEQLYDASDEPGEERIKKHAVEFAPGERVPWYVGAALTSYRGEYGPIHTVRNPFDDPPSSTTADGAEGRDTEPAAAQRTLGDMGGGVDGS